MSIAGKPGGKNILFVDANAAAQGNLQAKLLSLYDDWNIQFVSTAPEALKRMDGTAVDVLVADFRLSQMDGIELLDTVKKRYPTTIRFIMSPATDRLTITRQAGAVHPFLAKPLNVEEFKTSIGRALILREAMDDQKMKAIIADVKPMPTVPLLYDQISRALNSQFSSLEDIVQLISKDVSMSAKILQLVNSAFYALRSRVESVAYAVSLLGVNTIRGLVLGAGVFEKFSAAEMKLFDVQKLYAHSMEVGGLTHVSVKELHVDSKFQDLAVLTGMVHDFGKIILMRSDQNLYREVYRKSQEEHRAFYEVEQELLGVTHAEVGAYVLRQWGLSEVVVEAIALHHTPSRSREKHPNLLTAVHIANAYAQRTIVDGQEIVSELDTAYIQSLNLQDSLKSISKRFSAMATEKQPA